ncbi:SigE family RNA polymerase sigma factor [Actinoplanes sp. M2I2]|uniref:SigE family RNA polymerase sigma factor n=1 Tax=Actinoplanes sp. M2I2 TaxID=1734444 RepID=UPI002020BCBB|nr:SigE family RNA polymerase sigma factor [Actinoplanes sp. M2I2]
MSETDRDFREFVAAHLERLRALAYITCGDWQLAEDAVATVLSRMYPRWERIEQPAVYARQAVVRAAISEKRRPWWRRERSAGDALPEVSLADHSGPVDERLRLHAALLRVPVGLRSVLVLRFIEGLSVAETAEALGRPEGTVKNYTSRGLEAMRRILGPNLTDLEGDKHVTAFARHSADG